VHPNTVTNWITKEQLPILRRVGRVVELDLATAVQWVRAREQRAFDDKLKALTTSPDVQRAQYRKAVAAAERAELELGRLRGDLVPRSDVERLWSSHILRVRARLLSLPAHARVRGVGPEAVLEQLIRQALEDLARGEDEAA
jgi:phage terminase Nu1 subunit (DNA packaging protein)